MKNNISIFSPHHQIPPLLKKLTPQELSYYAGYVDGDGHLFVQIKPKTKNDLSFQINVSIGFYQPTKHYFFLQGVFQLFGGRGHLRKRPNSNMSDFLCSDSLMIKHFLSLIYPYLRLKKPQSKLVLEIIRDYKNLHTFSETHCPDGLPLSFITGLSGNRQEREQIFITNRQAAFLEVCKKVDQVASLNYSNSLLVKDSNRKYTHDTVLEFYKNNYFHL